MPPHSVYLPLRTQTAFDPSRPAGSDYLPLTRSSSRR